MQNTTASKSTVTQPESVANKGADCGDTFREPICFWHQMDLSKFLLSRLILGSVRYIIIINQLTEYLSNIINF